MILLLHIKPLYIHIFRIKRHSISTFFHSWTQKNLAKFKDLAINGANLGAKITKSGRVTLDEERALGRLSFSSPILGTIFSSPLLSSAGALLRFAPETRRHKHKTALSSTLSERQCSFCRRSGGGKRRLKAAV